MQEVEWCKDLHVGGNKMERRSFSSARNNSESTTSTMSGMGVRQIRDERHRCARITPDLLVSLEPKCMP